MTNIGIFYGSDGGATEDVAQRIAACFEKADLFAISKSNADKIKQYTTVILGTPTCGVGDLQDDWEDALPGLDGVDFSDKAVALFGLGDQDSFSDSFLEGMGILGEALVERGAHFVGRWDSEGYDFTQSGALVDGAFAGLAIDEDNQSDQTDERIAKWVEQIKSELQEEA